MKTISAILLTGVLASQAALIPFGLSPAGSSAATGLSPSNVVPPLAGTGSGGALGGSTVAGVFDTSNLTLQLSAAYGSAQGYGDLTGPATLLGIYGPGQTNENAALLFDLSPLHIADTNPASGGIIAGLVQYSTNTVSGLMGGLHYLSIATSNNPGGEIRGQLVKLDIPPSLDCPVSTNVPCGTKVDLTAGVHDTIGNAVSLVWALNGIPVQTNMVPAFQPPAATNVTFSATFPTGTNSVTLTAENAAGSVATCAATVVEVDTNPPVIISATPSKAVLWPPNHKMVKVTITAQTSDNCSEVGWKIVGVKSNEPVQGKGDGNTAPDWQVLNHHTVNLRAERSGNDQGRIYTVYLQARDSMGNLSETNTVTVTVPKSQGKAAKPAPAPLPPVNNGGDKGKGNGKK